MLLTVYREPVRFVDSYDGLPHPWTQPMRVLSTREIQALTKQVDQLIITGSGSVIGRLNGRDLYTYPCAYVLPSMKPGNYDYADFREQQPDYQSRRTYVMPWDKSQTQEREKPKKKNQKVLCLRIVPTWRVYIHYADV